MQLENKKILVVGLGKSGKASALFLKNRGAHVTVTDCGTRDLLKASADEMEESGINLELGGHEEKSFTQADLIVISPGVSHRMPEICAAKACGVPVWGEIELASRFIKEPVIAVTGTNGKTTTTTIIGEMLTKSGFKVFVGGNIGNPLIDYVKSDEKADVLVVELSSFQLDTIEEYTPYVAVILNITPDHLDRYPDMNAYAESKGRIFKNQRGGHIAIINGSDSLARMVSDNINSDRKFFDIDSDNEQKLFGIDFSKMKIAGAHNIENMRAASLAAFAVNASKEGVSHVVENFSGLSHRMEYVDTVDGVKFFNDSKATNPDAVARALESFEEPVVLIMGGRNKGNGFDFLEKSVSRNTRSIIAIGEAKKDILSRLGSRCYGRSCAASDMEEAVFRAYETANCGDVVLLSPACASFDMYRSYADRGEAFCQAVTCLQKVRKGA
ncbi:UDP-N-acetylmuramoyl-L-alanine--D-glutamate ligase [Desulfobacterales bacterium HSG16]|nr:UDP-N-acetylmuramoyl-L-alanine--D-glutamate ligase [Desulfobacterales bacterium HSG16]